eukprot:12745556-Alexandrium_andersonii.AAC.1
MHFLLQYIPLIDNTDPWKHHADNQNPVCQDRRRVRTLPIEGLSVILATGVIHAQKQPPRCIRAGLDARGIRAPDTAPPPTRETCTNSLEPTPLPQTPRLRNAASVQETPRACLCHADALRS